MSILFLLAVNISVQDTKEVVADAQEGSVLNGGPFGLCPVLIVL